MTIHHDTLLRQWLMLKIIPRFPKKISASEINSRLDSEHFKVTKRTVERDLIELSSTFPLVLDDKSKPYGWSWAKDAPSFDLPSLTKNEALMLMLIEQNLIQIIPPSLFAAMLPYFRASKQQLDILAKEKKIQPWTKKIRTIQPSQPLIPPIINSKIQDIVTEALLNDFKLKITYQIKNKSSNVYIVSPLCLVQRGFIIYLQVNFENKSNTRILALHRIKAAEILFDNFKPPKDFDIDRNIEEGFFGFAPGQKLHLVAKFSGASGYHLYETPLSKDQVIDENGKGDLVVSATVLDNPQLLWWLLAFGENIEVFEPVMLRNKIKHILQNSLNQYK